MKTKQISRVVIAVLVSTFTLSCKKTLEILPTDSIVADVAIRNMSDLEQAVTGVYSVMGNTNVFYRTSGNADIIISSLMSDENYLPTENSVGTGVNMYKWLLHPDEQNAWANWGSSVSTSNPVVFTGSNFAVIDRANRVLRALELIATNSSDEAARKNRFKAELLSLRAHCHFQVLKSYAESYEPQFLGIPYMDAINDAPGSVKPSRLTVAESFAKIEADLIEAKALINGSIDITRINKNTISAIEARVYLYEKKWDKAITAASEVISSVPLADTTQFKAIWTDAGTSEVLWKLKKDADNDKIGQFYKSSANIVEFAASPKLINAFDAVRDIRFKAYIKIDNSRGLNKTPNLVNKYAYNTNGLADIKLYRVAEMYLIRAEAYAESDNIAANITSANADLNSLRSVRIKDYVNTIYSTKAELITAIYNERFKELAFEGHRYFDLRRREYAIDRTPLASDDASGSSTKLTHLDNAYYLPIPGFELRANPNMKQNMQYMK